MDNTNKRRPLVVLTGPTAVGKTDISIALAKSIGGEIISADSMQVYKGMNIGTAKIMPEEMRGVKHFLIDVLEPEEDFDVTKFKRMANNAIEEIYSRNHIPVIVGGTGFYIQAVLKDVDFSAEDDEKGAAIRAELTEFVNTHGPQELHRLLSEIDETSAAAIHYNNVKRVIRAIEYYRINGTPISQHNNEQLEKESPYNYAYFVLNDARDLLYERINHRVDMMFEHGLEDEVERLLALGLTQDNTSMQGIGYKEFFYYRDGKVNLDELKESIKQDTRHFAKRQLTWFKREKDVLWMDYRDYNHDKNAVLEAMNKVLKERNII